MEPEIEKWCSIPGIQYSISSLGRLFNNERKEKK